MAMPALAEPFADSRDDYTTFAASRDRLGFGEQFTEGRDAREWLRAHVREMVAPDSISRCRVRRVLGGGPRAAADRDRPDPARRLPRRSETHRLATPSGRIEIFSRDIDGFGYATARAIRSGSSPTSGSVACAPHDYPLHLLANQPATRLHSQLDGGQASMDSKVQGREPIRMHPRRCTPRGLTAGEVVRVFNDRGSCLAGVVVDDRLRHGVAQLSTGAWYDPEDPC